ncbi:esterase [Yeosuana aromativorans]|uniref:Esterase n=1 Tax=Yeosuana aromativorans TaxID=288019 RepID=A0A8J3BIC6_9FLAO|nr:esterase [Yeosuana aromativorans]GGK16324.1 esterase [Yeosuana aromativorans]
MNSTEKEISFQVTNTYSTLNTLTSSTKYIWFVCHGMGHLSRYFLKYFDALNPEEHYIISPQAPSKYYIKPDFKHVGASWLTKEKTTSETENIMRYFDAVFKAEPVPKYCKLIVLGYSQGVSVAMRYVAKRQLACYRLIIMSGGIPKELTPNDFAFLKEKTKVSMIYGTDDEYLNDERIAYEKKKVLELFGETVQIIPFKGKHEVNKDIINTIGNS